MCIVRTPSWATNTSAGDPRMYALTCCMAPAKIPSSTSTSTSEAATPVTAREARRRSWNRFLRASGTRPFTSTSPIGGGRFQHGKPPGGDHRSDQRHERSGDDRPRHVARGCEDDELWAEIVDERPCDDEEHPTDHQADGGDDDGLRSEERTSELQSLMRISYAVFCLKKKKKT